MNDYRGIDTLSATITGQELMTLLGVGRGRISQLRSTDQTFPAAIASSSPRKPLYRRADVICWLVAQDRLPDALLPGLSPSIHSDQPPRWAFTADHAETVMLPNVHDPDDGPIPYVLWRYAHTLSADRVLWLLLECPRVDGAPRSRRSNDLFGDDAIHRDVLAALPPLAPSTTIGVYDALSDDVTSTIWWITVDRNAPIVTDSTGRRGTGTLAAYGPDLAAILGHRLPEWDLNAVTVAAAVQWVPLPGDAPEPVAVQRPAILDTPRAIRNGAIRVLADITGGVIDDPGAAVITALCAIGNAGWDTRIRYLQVEPYDSAQAERGREHTVYPLRAPASSSQETPPSLPVVEPGTDWSPALGWLARQPQYAAIAAKATEYYGYAASLTVAEIRRDEIPADVWTLIVGGLTAADSADDHLHRSAQAGLDGGYWMAWTTDPEPRTHPAYLTDNVLRYHVPRVAFPLADAVDEVILLATDVPSGGGLTKRHPVGFLRTRRDDVAPVPAPTEAAQRTQRSRLALAITALAYGIDEPFWWGGVPLLNTAPDGLTSAVNALGQVSHLRIGWESVTESLSDIDLPDTAGLDPSERGNTIAAAINKHHRPPRA